MSSGIDAQHPDKTLTTRILQIPLLRGEAANCLLMFLRWTCWSKVLTPLPYSNVESFKWLIEHKYFIIIYFYI